MPVRVPVRTVLFRRFFFFFPGHHHFAKVSSKSLVGMIQVQVDLLNYNRILTKLSLSLFIVVREDYLAQKKRRDETVFFGFWASALRDEKEGVGGREKGYFCSPLCLRETS